MDRVAAERYLDLMYSGSSGYAVLGLGQPAVNSGGSYRYNQFREQAFHLPEHSQGLLDAAAAAAGEHDVFITPLLRDRPTRRMTASAPLTSRYVWLDCDDWTNQIASELAELGLPVHLVDSGGVGLRRHVYLDIGTRLPGEDVARLAADLAKALGTDTAGGNNKYLRLPGTLNHQPRPRGGGTPAAVVWLEAMNPAGLAALDPLTRFLSDHGASRPPVAQGPRTAAGDGSSTSFPGHADACEPALLAADSFRKTMASGTRHMALQAPLLQVLRAGDQGHHGVSELQAELKAEFVAATSDSRGGDAQAEAEFDRAVSASGLKTNARGLYSICSCDIATYRRALNDASNFSKRGRRTERKIIQSLIREAEKTKSRKITKSTYQIAEDAECGQQTVARALPRVESGRFIEKRLNRGRATTILVLAEACTLESTDGLPASAGKEVDSKVRVGPTHPVFGSQGLRGNQELTFDCLDVLQMRHGRGYLLGVKKHHGKLVLGRRRGWRDISAPSAVGGQTAGQVALGTKQPVATVRRHLNQLKERGLAVKVTGLWYRLEWVPDLVAEERGIAEVPALRKQKHQDQRKRQWDGRANLPEGHRHRVLREEDGNGVLFLHPETGEFLWRDPRGPENNGDLC